jgi:hypothetical protein
MNDFNAGFHGDGGMKFSHARYKIILLQGKVVLFEKKEKIYRCR